MARHLATGKVLLQFLDRIAASLRERPLDLDPARHRRRLADLLARSGELTDYELLEVPVTAQEDEIHAAYEALGRVVHPTHAPELGLQGKETALEMLFERATEAYLTLSDPERRRRYDEIALVLEDALDGEGDGKRRRGSRRDVGRDLLAHARHLVDDGDYHFAVEVLRQAVRLEPGPEAWILLARAQAENDLWLHMAADSLLEALRLGEAGGTMDRTSEQRRDLLLSLGNVHELRGDRSRARRHYHEVLDRHPGHDETRRALERLDTVDKASEEDHADAHRQLRKALRHRLRQASLQARVSAHSP